MCTDDSACPGSAAPADRVPAPAAPTRSRQRPRGVRQRGRGAARRPGGRRLPQLPGRPGPGRGRVAGRPWSRSGRSRPGWRAAQNGMLRRFDADSAHDADGYATTAAWLAGRTGLGRKDAKATVRADAPPGPAPAARRRRRRRHRHDRRGRGRWPPGPARSATRRCSKTPTRSSSRPPRPGRTWTGCGSSPRPPTRPGAPPTPTTTRPARASRTASLQLDTTMDGAGRLTGDLTPECAAAVTAVLEALGKKRGPEDDRTVAQRYHDALQEGCELLIRAKMVPDRAGSDTRVDVQIPLSALRQHARRPRRRGSLAARPGRPARLPRRARTPRPPPATPSSSRSSPAPPTGTSSPR